ncbi:(2Fe-2S)-binding protein [Agrobacterium vitis]|uniref:(2Fe-2S)-binding protein n=1 Tax=Agrobacterium vitis TaxID=373 RepID=UPI000872FAD4|nr:(2Fe-2S)-binding protein [Agrobacterium vitis]MCE6075802.1 2Fe-2S iron-sulfur cluster binding domain-containing protein [Agrobacterium vitis]MCM2449272.1 (2Fe-2S)-binding protein [Agrobacterium vitis]MCM2468283.1 (2Fe-2S)-binding protein [Agrobacterium vitis]MUO70255.1 2Fe-2S iron-sulfur cluster binding domain-containing protein [Agrobacterium vitis]MUO82554.1 2Fe-2S iron-sulfur cluster binding domain-containing protein [Agrobacterium vitis]
MNLGFTLNGQRVTVECKPDTRLTEILRDRLHLTATKLACAIGRCGACSVLLDGRLANACLLMAWQIEDANIVTAEGLNSHPLGEAVREGLAEENAFQCGYCAPGFSLALVALFADNPQAGEKDIRAGLEGNLCRCTGYHSIIRGALNAACRIRAARAISGD